MTRHPSLPHDIEESSVSAWLMIGSILGSLAIMLTVVLGAATSLPLGALLPV